MSYYYNSIQHSAKEKSLTESMDQWGSNLITPYQKHYNGRTYKNESGNWIEVQTETKALTLGAKAKVLLGVILKAIAIWCNTDLKANYDSITSNEKISQKVKPLNKDGESAIDCCICLCNILFIAECCIICCG